MLEHVRAGAVALFLGACAGPPFDVAADAGTEPVAEADAGHEPDDSASWPAEALASPVTPTPLLPRPPALVEVPSDVVHGAHAAGGVAAIDLRGRDLGVLAIDGPVDDLAWHPTWGCLLVVEHLVDLDASRVLSVAWDGGGRIVAASDPVDGVARVFPVGDTALVVADSLGARWHALDASLRPLGAPRGSLRPSGLSADPSHSSAAVLFADAPASRVHTGRVTFDHGEWRTWPVATLDVAPTSARLAAAAEPRVVTFMGNRVSVLDLDGTGDSLAEVQEPPPGPLQAAALDGRSSVAHLLVQPGEGDPALLRSVDLRDGAGASSALGGHVDVTDWPCRCLELASDGVIVAATNETLDLFASPRADGGPAHVRQIATRRDLRVPIAVSSGRVRRR